MATRTTSMFVDETPLCAALNQPAPPCPEQLSTIYATHYRYVLRVCRHFFQQRADAEDAAAEVFLKLHRVLDVRNEAMPFVPWVSQVAGRHCIDRLRQGKREKSSRVSVADITGIPDDSALSPLSRVLRNEEHLEVRQQLIRLPKKFKVPLVLRYYKHMSYSEIARVLKTRLPAVRMMIFRAKEQLRRNLLRQRPG